MKKLLFCLFIIATLIFVFMAISLINAERQDRNPKRQSTSEFSSLLEPETPNSFELFITILITLVAFTTMLWLGHYFINWFPIIIYLAIILIVLCSLFPPWYWGYSTRYTPIGYSFIASPPKGAYGIDMYRLSVEYAAIIIPAIGLLYLFRKGVRTDLKVHSETLKVNRGGSEYKMRKPVLIILLICVSIIIFALGAIFSYYVRPNRYKFEFKDFGLVKMDIVTGRIWRWDGQRYAFVEWPQRNVFADLLETNQPSKRNRFVDLLETNQPPKRGRFADLAYGDSNHTEPNKR